jgi:hypothetical protein
MSVETAAQRSSRLEASLPEGTAFPSWEAKPRRSLSTKAGENSQIASENAENALSAKDLAESERNQPFLSLHRRRGWLARLILV